MTDDEEIENLRQSADRNIYADHPIAYEADDLHLDVVSAIERVEAGDATKTLGARDPPVSALLHSLEETDDGLAHLGRNLAGSLGREAAESYDRSEIIRLAVRVGLREGAPSYYERLQEAMAEHARETL